MKNWEKYLAEDNYSWKDMFIFLIDEGHMHNMAKEMISDGMLQELNPDEFDDMIKYLENKMRMY